MPTLTSHYAEICRLANRLPHMPSNRNAEIAALRPEGASHLAWLTTDQFLAQRLRRLGALIVVKGGRDDRLAEQPGHSQSPGPHQDHAHDE